MENKDFRDLRKEQKYFTKPLLGKKRLQKVLRRYKKLLRRFNDYKVKPETRKEKFDRNSIQVFKRERDIRAFGNEDLIKAFEKDEYDPE